MRKLLLPLAAAVALSLCGFAQTGSQDTSSSGTGTGAGQSTSTDTQTTTTTKSTKKSKHAKSEESGAASDTSAAGSAKESHITGCLAKDASGSGYMITNGKYKKGVEVKTSEDLSAHVGHEVKATGTWEKATSGEAGGAGAKGETMRTFNATKVDHISETCKMGAAKSKKGGEKTDKSAANPGF